MPKDNTLHKVVILGSGPIIIGQAAEFDYSGTQACNSMREEGIETVLINSNPATIMTDEDIADTVYIEPLTVRSVTRILEAERPDGLLAGFGGQTALNIAMELHQAGVLERLGVRLLGIRPDSIRAAEDREEFKALMEQIGEPVAPSVIVHSLGECVDFAARQGYPIIVRPAYTLGGTGGGIAHGEAELRDICQKGLSLSPIHQLLLEESLTGYKEIEYEVMRDSQDNCIIVCNMENFDPVGVHTGDSIVIAPSQTLTDKQYQMLRAAAFKIIRHLGIEGGCNIQYALDPVSDSYRVIEVNPRVSRSSALASKATGYPIAKVASKVAVGYALHELKNSITQSSSAFFEPSLDYVVVKIPKLPFDKFPTSQRTLGTQMKATGEVMSIGRTYEEALLKAVRSLESGILSLDYPAFSDVRDDALLEKLATESFDKLFAIAQLMRRGHGVEEIHRATMVDRWFLQGVYNIVAIQEVLRDCGGDDLEAVLQAGRYGIPCAEIARLTGKSAQEIAALLEQGGIHTVYKMVDTCSGEFDAATSYYYSCADKEDESVPADREKILVIGSGPIRIGQGVEFDYCCVHSVWAIKEAGYHSIIINNNPETVSTDFDTADKLYLEPLYIEDVMRVIRKEQPTGVVVQFGGQTAINLARELSERGVNILGTPFASIDAAEDREKFNQVLRSIGISAPEGYTATSRKALDEAVGRLGYPVMIRPSYVIGGRAMQIVHSPAALERYLADNGGHLSDTGGLLVDKYIQGKEIEVDAICDGKDILVPGIMEHIERTGVHSGDSISVYPAAYLAHEVVDTLIDYTGRIGRALGIRGIFNIQYVYDGSTVRVIEVNPRASRTVPILCKLTGVPMVRLATRVMLGQRLGELGYGTGLYKKAGLYGVKIPIFSNEKLIDVDVAVGPEMKSTGEVLGVDRRLDRAIHKAFEAAGARIVDSGNLYVALDDRSKEEGAQLVEEYARRGFAIYSGGHTADYLQSRGIALRRLEQEGLMQALEDGTIQLLLNTPTRGGITGTAGFQLRRKASEYKVQSFTCLDTARFFLKAVDLERLGE